MMCVRVLGLRAGVAYTFTVAAVDAAGRSSAASRPCAPVCVSVSSERARELCGTFLRQAHDTDPVSCVSRTFARAVARPIHVRAPAPHRRTHAEQEVEHGRVQPDGAPAALPSLTL